MFVAMSTCTECNGTGESSRKDRNGEYLPCRKCDGIGITYPDDVPAAPPAPPAATRVPG